LERLLVVWSDQKKGGGRYSRGDCATVTSKSQQIIPCSVDTIGSIDQGDGSTAEDDLTENLIAGWAWRSQEDEQQQNV